MSGPVFIDLPPTKIGMGLVAPDMMDTPSAMCFARIATYTSGVLGHDVQIIHEPGSILVQQRQSICDKLLTAGCEWLFFMDSDMVVPTNTIHGMLSRQEKVVAANCVRRKRPCSPTARKANTWMNQGGTSELIYTRPDSTGLEQVESIGFGVILIHRSVFEALPRPYFDHVWQPEVMNAETGLKGMFSGEDIYFCLLCREAGIPIYIDHDVSWHIGHIGNYVYRHQDALAEAELVDSGAWGDVPDKNRLQEIGAD